MWDYKAGGIIRQTFAPICQEWGLWYNLPRKFGRNGMPRRVDPSKKTKRDWRWYASIGLNGIVALSMILGTVFLFTGAPTRSIPTIEVPTAAPATAVPTLAPTPAPPTPTPKASASNYTFAVVGDSRDGDVVYKKVLNQVMSDGSELLIHTGDLVPSGTIEN